MRNLQTLYWQPVDLTLGKLMNCFKQMYPNFVDRANLTLPEIDAELPNPIYHPLAKGRPIVLPVHIAITHGDLNGTNIFVDQDNHGWLIDFFRTGEGHIMRDFVELESVVKFQLLEETDFSLLYAFEMALLAADSFDCSPSLSEDRSSPSTRKALTVVAHLRELAGTVVQPTNTMRDYYAGLFYHTLRSDPLLPPATISEAQVSHLTFGSVALRQIIKNIALR